MHELSAKYYLYTCIAVFQFCEKKQGYCKISDYIVNVKSNFSSGILTKFKEFFIKTEMDLVIVIISFLFCGDQVYACFFICKLRN